MRKKWNLEFIYFLAFTLSACSLFYELLIAHTISTLVTNGVICYSCTIGFYLIAMGLGAYFCKKIFPTQDAESLVRIEFFLSFLGSAAVFIIYFTHMLFCFFWVTRFIGVAGNPFAHLIMSGLFYFVVIAIILAVGFLSGLELPLLIRLGNQCAISGEVTNKVLSADYFGALFAGLAFPLIFLQTCDSLKIGLIVALLNIISALMVVVIFHASMKKVVLSGLKGSGLLIMIVAGLLNVQSMDQYFLKKYYYYDELASFKDLFRSMPERPDIQRVYSSYNRIDLVEKPEYRNELTRTLINAYSKKDRISGAYPKGKILFLNRDFQFNTDIEEIYHEFFAHVPVVVNKRVPRNVLVLGAGDGLLIRELIKYSKIQKITQVEVDREMLRIALENKVLRQLNEDSLRDSRVNVIVADAYHFLRHTDNQYDAIYIDFPAPTNYDLSKLYSVEFYSFLRTHLKKDGFVAFDSTWVTGYPESTKDQNPSRESAWGIYCNTLRQAGFEHILPYFINLEYENPGIEFLVDKKIQQIFEQGKNREFIEAYNFMERTHGKSFVIKKILKSHSQELQQGFIMMKMEPFEEPPVWRDLGVHLDVLNVERFQRAFLFSLQDDGKKDLTKVNSIMRPTLPDLIHSNGIKLPY